jgi:hypothetical protein
MRRVASVHIVAERMTFRECVCSFADLSVGSGAKSRFARLDEYGQQHNT